MPATFAMDRPHVRPMLWALGLSLAAHVALVVFIQAQPGGAPSLGGNWTVHARIEHQAPAATDAVEARSELPAQTKSEQPPTAPSDEVQSNAAPAREPTKADTKTATPVDAGPQNASAPTRGIEMPFVRDPTYYSVAALDSPPRLLGAADVCYPQGAVGEVAYVLMINEQGVVDQVTVAALNPQGLFTGAAVDLCSRLKFTPGVKDGRAVRSRVRFVVGANPT